MKKITYSVFLLTFLLSFSFCKVKQYTPSDYPNGQVLFGSGGGITGGVNSYSLFENGDLFYQSALDTSFVVVKKIKNNVVQQVFSNIEFLKLKDVKVNQPGNMYNFIQIKDKNNDHQIVWSGKDKVSKEVINFYDMLNHLTSK